MADFESLKAHTDRALEVYGQKATQLQTSLGAGEQWMRSHNPLTFEVRKAEDMAKSLCSATTRVFVPIVNSNPVVIRFDDGKVSVTAEEKAVDEAMVAQQQGSRVSLYSPARAQFRPTDVIMTVSLMKAIKVSGGGGDTLGRWPVANTPPGIVQRVYPRRESNQRQLDFCVEIPSMNTSVTISAKDAAFDACNGVVVAGYQLPRGAKSLAWVWGVTQSDKNGRKGEKWAMIRGVTRFAESFPDIVSVGTQAAPGIRAVNPVFRTPMRPVSAVQDYQGAQTFPGARMGELSGAQTGQFPGARMGEFSGAQTGQFPGMYNDQNSGMQKLNQSGPTVFGKQSGLYNAGLSHSHGYPALAGGVLTQQAPPNFQMKVPLPPLPNGMSGFINSGNSYPGTAYQTTASVPAPPMQGFQKNFTHGVYGSGLIGVPKPAPPMDSNTPKSSQAILSTHDQVAVPGLNSTTTPASLFDSNAPKPSPASFNPMMAKTSGGITLPVLRAPLGTGGSLLPVASGFTESQSSVNGASVFTSQSSVKIPDRIPKYNRPILPIPNAPPSGTPKPENREEKEDHVMVTRGTPGLLPSPPASIPLTPAPTPITSLGPNEPAPTRGLPPRRNTRSQPARKAKKPRVK